MQEDRRSPEILPIKSKFDVIDMYRRLMKFYDVDSIMGLVDAQHAHIQTLQKKLQELNIK